ncbi:MAG: hypothetical protein NZ740_10765, partial [Kiritimatiellae bacterium]|nr:hypothetical protein [Kiritimatiellia bacterium]MDW8459565.1 hypothetical protein [Verrucomicrobiota bacterium]
RHRKGRLVATPLAVARAAALASYPENARPVPARACPAGPRRDPGAPPSFRLPRAGSGLRSIAYTATGAGIGGWCR